VPTRTLAAPAARWEHSQLPPHETDGFTSASSPFAIGVTFTGHRGAVVRPDGGRATALDLAPGSVGINGGRPLAWLRTHEPSEAVEVVPHADTLASSAAEHGVSWQRLGGYTPHRHDPVVWAACVRVRHALVTGTASAEAADELVTGLLGHVAVTYAGGRTAVPRTLDRRRLATVTARVHDAPFAPHPLTDLAAAAHLSPHHFLRSFARATGLTPHRYVCAVRAERVRRLLAVPGASVTSVAADVGLDPRHLRRLHRAAIGASPRGL
jgi:AraC family transcriptional regulator